MRNYMTNVEFYNRYKGSEVYFDFGGMNGKGYVAGYSTGSNTVILGFKDERGHSAMGETNKDMSYISYLFAPVSNIQLLANPTICNDENIITIEIPEGYIVNEERSKEGKIVLKKADNNLMSYSKSSIPELKEFTKERLGGRVHIDNLLGATPANNMELYGRALIVTGAKIEVIQHPRINAQILVFRDPQ